MEEEGVDGVVNELRPLSSLFCWSACKHTALLETFQQDPRPPPFQMVSNCDTPTTESNSIQMWAGHPWRHTSSDSLV